MESVRLSVTVKKSLTAKYDASGLRALNAAIRRWAAAGKRNGIKTIHVAVDDAKRMKSLKVAPLTGTVTAAKVKVAVDALCAKLTPDYLVLIGSGDVVPFFEVANPTFNEDGDDEATVPTDNPYACSRKFKAAQRTSYLVPDRVMGRIPDLPGSSDPAWLVTYLDRASGAASLPLADYRGAYMVCCDTWKGAGQGSARKIGESAAELMISPPVVNVTPSMRARLGARMHMIKCHGAPLTAEFYGQRGGSYPPVLQSPTLPGRIRPGTVVGAMCCYGAEVFSPNAPGATLPGRDPISITYLRQGAIGFAGSTNTAWVGIRDLQCADWVVTGFLKGVTEGASLGRGLLDSKQNLASWVAEQGQSMGRGEEKTLLQFVLLGDPAIHPVVAPKSAPAGPRGVATAGMAARATLTERRLRRAKRAQRAEILRDDLPSRAEAGRPARARAIRLFRQAKAMLKLAPGNLGLKVKRVIVDVVTRKAWPAEPAGRRAAMTLAGVPRVRSTSAFDYYWVGRKSTKGPRQLSMVCVTTDSVGTPLRMSVVVSS